MTRQALQPGEWAGSRREAVAEAEQFASPGRKRGTRAGPLAAVALVLAGGFVVYEASRTPETPQVEVSRPPPAIVGLGYLEPSSTVVRVGASGGAGVSTKVATLDVAEGDSVEAGQILARLDTAPRLAAQVAESEAQCWLKALQFERQRLDLANNLASRQAALTRARAELDVSKTEWERQRSLLWGNVVSRFSYDKAARDYVSNQATVAEMEAALTRMAATVTGPDGTSDMQIDLAVTQAELASTVASLAAARASLAEAVIRAPFAGRVLSLNAHVGEQIGASGLLDMGNVLDMRAVVEVYQTDIGRVHVGDIVRLRADALPGSISGRVERIGAAVQRQTIVNNDPAAATDARVVQVFVALDAEASRAVSGLSRLQVQAVFGR